MKTNSTQQRVVEEYFRTTSATGSAGSQQAFDASLAGLRRRLGPWLDLRDKDVLDLGSGTGEVCRLAHDEGASSIVGVNLSLDEIEYARTQVNASFIHNDIADHLAECQPSSVDCVFALNILEHLDKDALVQVVEGVFRVLRNGGQLIIMVPNATSPFGGMTRYWDITHYNAFTPSSMRQVAKLVGFQGPMEFRECGPIPHGVVSTVRYLLWQAIRMAIKGYLLIELASDKGGIYTADMMVRLTKSPAENSQG